MLRKKRALALFIFFLSGFFLLKVGVIYSQDTKPSSQVDTSRLDKAYEDYSQQFEEYQTAHSDYVVKKAQYLRFKTLTSKSDAYDATLLMLQKRDDVVVSYIRILKTKLDVVIGITSLRREALQIRLDDEIGWFLDHKNKLSSAGTLEDLVVDSNDAKVRFDSGGPLFYESMANMSFGRVVDFQERLTDLFSSIKDKVEDIKSEQREDYILSERKLQNIDRWILESDNRIQRGVEKQTKGETDMLTFISTEMSGALGDYNTTLTSLTEAQIYYKEAGAFLREVIREIKIAEE
ncbi:hypothetical protein A2955_00425 [Candidatus Woesebacteria bacterium RIFCSPLOWO2_01_FULL_37_19]|uniref:Uncharacterized protein n=2 Tax=Candidatus Woeseibacteriota TaxID=1752722 RepID=A0A1F8B5N8_9BACT|nr:MAG: hypothetical protein A2771_03755 [Candidatus Woesebacteria bacterium RIFCSPHIGHO2_01_FULL_38_26b]OGM59346.1 MAG: hypothetical protein A2955_00425 [Candidatus Woesebacteria bacterium RIFCSPLOWO2_01_FULL_37_19]